MLLRSLDNAASKYLFFQSVTLQRRKTHAWVLCERCSPHAIGGLRIDSVNINIWNEISLFIYFAKLGLSRAKGMNLPNFRVKCRLPLTL